MPSIDLPGARLHYRTVGSGKPLVLVHGSATDMTTWDGVIDNLASDHRVTVYDRRGYGQSEHRPVRDHRIHARDLCAVLEQAVGEPAKVLGWSSGGNIVLASATARPDLFSELVVVEAPFHGLRHADRAVLATAVRLKLLQLRGHPQEATEVFFRFATALQSGGNSYDLADDSLRNDILRNATPVLAEWDPHPFGVMAEHISVRAVVKLPMPITWVLGSESSPWMTGLHTRVQRRRPDIDTVVINGAGHLIHLDCPAEFVAAVRGEPTRTDHTAHTGDGS
ncbi:MULTISPECIES: alpha/beta fold hydrolase [unclassified Rhodococcus (in: high G+C Gram-positive bacteria)]|jgi:pimeloyl-ACP methyl ester carboxylesterase|uniref:alpha/beta fold hydrolase n=1 Tax=unclassified Rhodococcus (in: high G+C Gram-positive bacteria) TaxID=192944 RepID=UPI0002F2A8CA|nr:alpha/beta hydrolase [Rhodococcus sp. DK17]